MRKDTSIPMWENTGYHVETPRPVLPNRVNSADQSKNKSSATAFSYLYCVMQETYATPDVSAYTGYGIAVYQRRGERMDLLVMIPDISTKQEFIAGLVDMLNDFKVEYAHLFDVIEDYLYLYL